MMGVMEVTRVMEATGLTGVLGLIWGDLGTFGVISGDFGIFWDIMGRSGR